MRSATILLQVVGVALVAPSLAQTQFGPSGAYRFQERGSSFGVVPPTTIRPKVSHFQIVAEEQPAPAVNPVPVPARSALQKQEDEQLLREQAQSAKYAFATSLSDRIMDGEHIRQENRDGLKTTGMYSYSDGFFRRTVEYIADENGYRVVKQTVEPIGDGPQPDPTGSADVSAFYDRSKLQYSITADDIRGYPRPEDLTLSPVSRGSVFPPQSKAIFTRAQNQQTDDDFTTTTENILRSVERHDTQVPSRPPPFLRNGHILRTFP